MDKFLIEDDRFQKLHDKETGLKLLAEFIEGRQKCSADKRIKTDNTVRLMLVDAVKAVNLGGEKLLCEMLAEAIKSGSQGWYWDDKAVRLFKQMSKS